MLKKSFNIKNKNGFSILEVVVAMAIISTGLLGVSSLVIQNFQAQSVNRDYLIASMLAQEGLELVRNIRDSNWYNGSVNWYDGIYDNNDVDFTIDYDDTSDFSVDGINNSDARLKLNGGFYSHDAGGTDTPFYRLIKTSVNGDALTATSTVQWSERGRVHSYIAETVLYNWK